MEACDKVRVYCCSVLATVEKEEGREHKGYEGHTCSRLKVPSSPAGVSAHSGRVCHRWLRPWLARMKSAKAKAHLPSTRGPEACSARKCLTI